MSLGTRDRLSGLSNRDYNKYRKLQGEIGGGDFLYRDLNVVYTKPVNIHFHALRLATQAWDIHWFAKDN